MDIHTTSIPARTIVGIRRADSNPGEMFSSASEDVFAFVNRHGLQLGVDYGLTHSCYDPGDAGRPCRHCDSCRLRAAGFAEVGISDPLLRA